MEIRLFPLKRLAAAVVIAGTALTAAAAAHAESKELNLYSYRQPFLIQPLLDTFAKETGIKVNVVYAQKGMLEKIKAAGANSPADAVLTVDIGRLHELKEAGVLQPVKSAVLDKAIPAHLRDPQGLWFALTTRARVALVSKDRVKPGELTSYEQLADPKFKGRICVRSGKNDYNIALIASMIAHHGEEATEEWLEGLKDNLARKPQGGDRDQIKAIHAGECDIAIGNSYYYGNMLNDENQREAAESVRLVFPNAAGRGTHINISGIALTKSAPNRDNAIRLMEFLSEPKAQQIYAEANTEYPANPDVKPSGMVAEWGEINPDDLSLQEIAENRSAAVKMVDRVDYDN